MVPTHEEADYGKLFRLAGEIGRESDLKGLLIKILEKSRPWIRAEACSIFLPDPSTGELVIHSARGRVRLTWENSESPRERGSWDRPSRPGS
jgi:hypothetical protein